MKILVVHNDYGRYSGEEAVVDRMIADGRRLGYEIETLRRTSAGRRETLMGKMHGFVSGIFSISSRRMMREALERFLPDAVHIHNLYPFISPSVLFICRKRGVPVIMTVHNYRLVCPTGLFLRDGKPCERCMGKGHELNCIRYNCEHSLFRTVGFTLRNRVARRTRAYLDCVDYYFCLTEFQKQKLVEAGFDKEKILVFPNYIDDEGTERVSVPSGEQTPFVGYVGRLSEEKGYDLLIEVARRHPDIEFRFAGKIRDGFSVEAPDNVKLLGTLTKEQLEVFYNDARFIVLPSRCYEGFPIVLLEASSLGKACVAPAHGAFPDLLTDPDSGLTGGRLFKPLDVDDLEKRVLELWNNPELCSELGAIAGENYRKRFLKERINGEMDRFLKQTFGKDASRSN